jgi:hypothetical protein
MATVMRMAGNEEGKGGKAMAMAARVAGKPTVTTTKWVMGTKTREAGKEEGDGKGSKSEDNGEEQP